MLHFYISGIHAVGGEFVGFFHFWEGKAWWLWLKEGWNC
jgi:hypothetical protein